MYINFPLLYILQQITTKKGFFILWFLVFPLYFLFITTQFITHFALKGKILVLSQKEFRNEMGIEKGFI